MGDGINNKILEVSQTSLNPPNLAQFTISNAKVLLWENSNINIDAQQLTIDGITLTSNTGQYNGHGGLHFYGQPDLSNVKINNSYFSYGLYGINAQLSNINHSLKNPLKINSCFFNNCKTALKVNGAGVLICGIDINNNNNNNYQGDYGISLNGCWLTSTISNAIILHSSQYGIYNSPPTEKKLEIFCSTISNNNNGIYQESGNLLLNSSSIKYNNYAGIYLTNDAYLDISRDYGGGYNNITNNQYYNIYFDKVTTLPDLMDGYSLLYNNYGSILYGQLNLKGPYPVPPYYINANHNKWNSDNINLPPSGKCNVYVYINKAYFGKALISDNYPLSSSILPSCVPCNSNPHIPPYNPQLLSGLNDPSNPINNCSSCTQINTVDFINTSYNEAVKEAMMNMEETDTTKNNLNAVNLFSEILSTHIDSTNSQVLSLAELAFRNMNYAFSDAFLTGKLKRRNNNDTMQTYFSKVLGIYNKLQKIYINGNNMDSVSIQAKQIEKFYIDLGKAQLYRLIGNYDTAMLVLDSIGNCYLGENELKQILHWKKLMNAENLVITGQVPKEKFDSLYPIDGARLQRVPFGIDSTAHLDTTATIGTNCKMLQGTTIGANC